MSYLLDTYPTHALSLDVSTDNAKAVSFYRKMGLKIQKLYLSPDEVEFALFETPLDKRGAKLDINDPQMSGKQVQPYYDDIAEYKRMMEKDDSEEEEKVLDDQISQDTKSSEKNDGSAKNVFEEADE